MITRMYILRDAIMLWLGSSDPWAHCRELAELLAKARGPRWENKFV